MKYDELVDIIKNDNPAAFNKVPDKRAARIIRLALIELGKQIDAADEGPFRVPGFGSFRVRQVEQEKGGKKNTVKRIVFRATQAKPAK